MIARTPAGRSAVASVFRHAGRGARLLVAARRRRRRRAGARALWLRARASARAREQPRRLRAFAAGLGASRRERAMVRPSRDVRLHLWCGRNRTLRNGLLPSKRNCLLTYLKMTSHVVRTQGLL
eukprot:3993182-Pleurochrysis_carterae.AAC.2